MYHKPLPILGLNKRIAAEFQWGFAMIEHNLYFKSSAIKETLKTGTRFNLSTFEKGICGTFLVPLGNTSVHHRYCSSQNHQFITGIDLFGNRYTQCNEMPSLQQGTKRQ